MAFNIDEVNVEKVCEAGYEFEVKLPNGKATGAFLKVQGEYADGVRKFKRQAMRSIQEKYIAARKKGEELQPMTLEEEDVANLSEALTYLVGWRGFTEGKDNKEIPFTKANAEKLLKANSWMIDIILEEARDISNFQF